VETEELAYLLGLPPQLLGQGTHSHAATLSKIDGVIE